MGIASDLVSWASALYNLASSLVFLQALLLNLKQ